MRHRHTKTHWARSDWIFSVLLVYSNVYCQNMEHRVSIRSACSYKCFLYRVGDDMFTYYPWDDQKNISGFERQDISILKQNVFGRCFDFGANCRLVDTYCENGYGTIISTICRIHTQNTLDLIMLLPLVSHFLLKMLNPWNPPNRATQIRRVHESRG